MLHAVQVEAYWVLGEWMVKVNARLTEPDGEMKWTELHRYRVTDEDPEQDPLDEVRYAMSFI